MDSETFELCKEVRKVTDWVELELYNGVPRYNSDYLLEKLPRYINQPTNELLVARWGGNWRACYMPIDLGHYPDLREQASTPLKALLKLTLVLHEAGELINAMKGNK